MKVALVTVGSRGDVEPYIAFGQRLKQRGHSVRVAALALFKQDVIDAGLEFHSLGALPERFKPRSGGDGARTRRDASTLFRGVSGRVLFWAFFPGMLRPALDRFISACEGADAVVFNRLALPVPHVAERFAIPCFAGFPVPHTPTRAFENPLYVQATASGPLRTRATYAIEWGLTHQLSYNVLARFRRDRLGLPALSRGVLREHMARTVRGTLYAYSEAVVPRPDDWPESVQVTGYWSRSPPESFQPPADVERFLNEGDPPVAVGFGSMKASDAKKLAALLEEALAKVKRRAIWQSGFSDLRSSHSRDRILVTGQLPHGWLFPRVAAVIHHGGAGTTGAALRAKVPSIIVPHAFDQRFWGRRVAALRCGPPPIDIEDLTASGLARALQLALEDDRMRAALARLGDRLNAEDGPARAAEQLERWITAA
jgi:sterol 3beta-glucosyltransferase